MSKKTKFLLVIVVAGLLFLLTGCLSTKNLYTVYPGKIHFFTRESAEEYLTKKEFGYIMFKGEAITIKGNPIREGLVICEPQ